VSVILELHEKKATAGTAAAIKVSLFRRVGFLNGIW
jgi:hypothetical protein